MSLVGREKIGDQRPDHAVRGLNKLRGRLIGALIFQHVGQLGIGGNARHRVTLLGQLSESRIGRVPGRLRAGRLAAGIGDKLLIVALDRGVVLDPSQQDGVAVVAGSARCRRRDRRSRGSDVFRVAIKVGLTVIVAASLPACTEKKSKPVVVPSKPTPVL